MLNIIIINEYICRGPCGGTSLRTAADAVSRGYSIQIIAPTSKLEPSIMNIIVINLCIGGLRCGIPSQNTHSNMGKVMDMVAIAGSCCRLRGINIAYYEI